MKNKVWFITGTSQGFGLQIAKKLIEQGHKVAATSRNPKSVIEVIGKSENLLAIKMDLANQKEIDQAVKKTVEKFGCIDILLNNAGYGQLWTFEETSDEEIRKCFEVNFFGTLNVTRAVLPIMRQQKTGHIFTTSSVWGYTGVPYNSTYAAVKFATDGWTESISHELKPLGITVSCIKPGGFRTNFLSSNSMVTGDARIKDYESEREKWFNVLNEYDNNQDGDPERYSDFIINITNIFDELPVHIFAGRDAYKMAEDKMSAVQKDMKVLEKSAADLHVR